MAAAPFRAAYHPGKRSALMDNYRGADVISEQDLHILVVDYLRAQWPGLLWWHVPNAINVKGGKKAGAFNKRLGVRPGVADLQFVLPDGSGCAAFIELKREGGYQTKSQKEFQAAVEARGCPYAVCRSLEDVQETLREWMGLVPTKADG